MARKEPNLTPVSDEEYDAIMEELALARESGDEDRYERALLQIPISASMANELKHFGGLPELIDHGINLSRVVAVYGEDWLTN